MNSKDQIIEDIEIELGSAFTTRAWIQLRLMNIDALLELYTDIQWLHKSYTKVEAQ